MKILFCVVLSLLCLDAMSQPAATETWRTLYDTSLNSNDEAIRVKCDSAQNVYVLARGFKMHTLAKFSPDGNIAWARRLILDDVTDLEIDSTGDAFLLGSAVGCLVMRFDSVTGNEVWRQDVPTGGNLLLDLELDSAQNLLLTSKLDVAADSTMWITRLSAQSGNQLWQQLCPAGAQPHEDSLLIDRFGNSFIVRVNKVVSYNAAGSIRWSKDIVMEQLAAAAVAPDGDFVWVYNTPPPRFTIVNRYDGATGNIAWTKSFGGSRFLDELPVGATVGTDNDVYFACYHNQPGISPDRTSFFRLAAENGNAKWHTTYLVQGTLPSPTGPAPSPKLDAAGNLYFAFWNVFLNYPWHIVKVSGSDGSILSSRQMPAWGLVRDTALTSSGYMVLGRSYRTTNTDAIVFKLNPANLGTTWFETFSGFGGAQDDVSSMTTFGDYVYVVGTTGEPPVATYGGEFRGTIPNPAIEVSQYSGISGRKLWTRLARGSSPVYNTNFAHYQLVFSDTDSLGNVYALGRMPNKGYLLAKFTKSGSLGFHREVVIDTGLFGVVETYDVKKTPDGNIVVVAANSSETFVNKHNATTGSVIWTKKLPGSQRLRLAADIDGSFYVLRTGELTKLDMNGNSLWTRPNQINGTSQGFPNSLLVSQSGVLYTACEKGIAAYSTATGATLWETPSPPYDSQIVLSGGTLIASGTSGIVQFDLRVVRYNAASGVVLWTKDIPHSGPGTAGTIVGSVVADAVGRIWTADHQPYGNYPSVTRILQLSLADGNIIGDTTPFASGYSGTRAIAPYNNGALVAGTTRDVFLMRFD